MALPAPQKTPHTRPPPPPPPPLVTLVHTTPTPPSPHTHHPTPITHHPIPSLVCLVSYITGIDHIYSGLIMKYLYRGSDYYIDTGASELVASPPTPPSPHT